MRMTSSAKLTVDVENVVIVALLEVEEVAAARAYDGSWITAAPGGLSAAFRACRSCFFEVVPYAAA